MKKTLIEIVCVATVALTTYKIWGWLGPTIVLGAYIMGPVSDPDFHRGRRWP